MNLKAAAFTITTLGVLTVASAITTFDVEVIFAPEESVPVEEFEHQEETIFVGNQEEASI